MQASHPVLSHIQIHEYSYKHDIHILHYDLVSSSQDTVFLNMSIVITIFAFQLYLDFCMLVITSPIIQSFVKKNGLPSSLNLTLLKGTILFLNIFY